MSDSVLSLQMHVGMQQVYRLFADFVVECLERQQLKWAISKIGNGESRNGERGTGNL